MAKGNWFNWEGSFARHFSNALRYGREATSTVMAGLLIGTIGLGLVGCSKENSKPVSSLSSPTPTASASAGGVGTTISTTMPSKVETTELPVEKKVVKHRSPIVKYNNSTYGVSFQYPWQYGFKPGHRLRADAEREDVATKYVQPGGVNLVTIELPRGFYPDTDLNYAFFSANVNKNMTAEECSQFESEQPAQEEQGNDGSKPQQPANSPSKVTVGGIQFDAVHEMQDQSDEKYFHVFQNGACYEFALGLVSGDESEDGAKLVDHDKVFARLEKLLGTVSLNTEPSGEVTASVPTTATDESKQ